MNNRERSWYEGEYGRHPDTCQCVECTRKRLARSEGEVRIEEEALSRLRKRTPEEEEEYRGHCKGRQRTSQSAEEQTVGWDSSRLDSNTYEPPIELHPAEVARKRERNVWLVKLGLSLSILTGFILLVAFGYRVFLVQYAPIWQPIVLLLFLALWVVMVRFSRNWWRRPR